MTDSEKEEHRKQMSVWNQEAKTLLFEPVLPNEDRYFLLGVDFNYGNDFEELTPWNLDQWCGRGSTSPDVWIKTTLDEIAVPPAHAVPSRPRLSIVINKFDKKDAVKLYPMPFIKQEDDPEYKISTIRNFLFNDLGIKIEEHDGSETLINAIIRSGSLIGATTRRGRGNVLFANTMESIPRIDVLKDMFHIVVSPIVKPGEFLIVYSGNNVFDRGWTFVDEYSVIKNTRAGDYARMVRIVERG